MPALRFHTVYPANQVFALGQAGVQQGNSTPLVKGEKNILKKQHRKPPTSDEKVFTTSQHQTDAQTVSKAIATLERCPPVLLLSMNLQSMEQPARQLGSAVLAVPSPSPLLPLTAPLLQGQSEKQRQPRCCVGTVQLLLKTLVCSQHHCGHKSQSSIRAAMKKVNSTPARPSTLQDHILFLDKFGLTQATPC